MTDEFIDFYEALGLPLEADRKQIRSRIAEVYTEAQRNLDHRNFQTRVEYQKMFEVVLPRARYILLDEGRRDEYDQLVRAFRGDLTPITPQVAPAPVAPGAAPPTPAFGKGDASSFRLAEETVPINGKAPRVEGLPASAPDLQQMAHQRDELWQKWKAGLEAAIARDERAEATPKPSPSKPSTSASPTTSPTETVPQPRAPRAPATPIAFDFGADNAGKRGDSAPVPGAEELVEEAKHRLSPQEMARVREERTREATKEILTAVGLKAVLLGSLGTGIPLALALVAAMGHYYPQGAKPLIGLPSSIAWCLGIAVVLVAGYFAAHFLSRSMRHKRANELAMMSLEDILRELGRSY